MAAITLYLRNEPIINLNGDGDHQTLHVSCKDEHNTFTTMAYNVLSVDVEKCPSWFFVSVFIGARKPEDEIQFTGYDIQDFGDDVVAEPTPVGVEYYNQNALETHLDVQPPAPCFCDEHSVCENCQKLVADQSREEYDAEYYRQNALETRLDGDAPAERKAEEGEYYRAGGVW